MKIYTIDGIEYKDYKEDYWDSYGDYHEIYEEKLNFLDQGICKDIAGTILHLPKDSIVTIPTYLREFQINAPKEVFKFSYEILKYLEGILILPETHYKEYIAFPFNMPYLKIK